MRGRPLKRPARASLATAEAAYVIDRADLPTKIGDKPVENDLDVLTFEGRQC
jgi:hypothetical protein